MGFSDFNFNNKFSFTISKFYSEVDLESHLRMDRMTNKEKKSNKIIVVLFIILLWTMSFFTGMGIHTFLTEIDLNELTERADSNEFKIDQVATFHYKEKRYFVYTEGQLNKMGWQIRENDR